MPMTEPFVELRVRSQADKLRKSNLNQLSTDIAAGPVSFNDEERQMTDIKPDSRHMKGCSPKKPPQN